MYKLIQIYYVYLYAHIDTWTPLCVYVYMLMNKCKHTLICMSDLIYIYMYMLIILSIPWKTAPAPLVLTKVQGHQLHPALHGNGLKGAETVLKGLPAAKGAKVQWPADIYIYIFGSTNLVGGIPTPLQNMKVNWDDYPL